jgi:hypothetical protein
MTMNRLFLRGIVAGLFLCLTGSLAFGQSNRTWVSGTGTDPANCAATVCTRSAACATFACALQATNPGGEIDALDSGDFGPLNGTNSITKSISIVAQGVVAGIQASNAIDVTGSSVVVVLRGLTLDGLGGGYAIAFQGDGVLHIEGCTTNDFDIGILVEPHGSTKVFIKDTIVRNNSGTAGIFFGGGASAPITASLDNVRLENNSGVGAEASNNATVSVRNSVAAGNGTGFQTDLSGPSRPVVMNLESSMASGNATGVNADGANSTINMSNVTVVNNGTGLSTTSGGHIVSFGNNKVTDNTMNGSPTKTISQK